jgi:hypothetical protein
MPDFNDFLSRIQIDHEFYLQFRKNPNEALAPYELSSEERAALTDSGSQLSARLGEVVFTLTGTKNFVSLGSADWQFDPVAALMRPEIQHAIAQIRNVTTNADRLTPVLALIEHVG